MTLNTVVLISANSEWRAVMEILAPEHCESSPYGPFFSHPVKLAGADEEVLFFHGGWGKTAAAGSTQYVIDRWSPRILINLGTCGGFAGYIERGDIVLAEKTVVYDLLEQMGDQAAHIAHYTTTLDLSWLDGKVLPQPVIRTLLVSGDRDLVCSELPMLRSQYDASAGDWESGAIAYVAKRNGVRLLILRGVTDLVGEEGGEAYGGNIEVFHQGAREIMRRLLEHLGAWIELSQL